MKLSGKYRPRRFSEVRGQDKAVSYLSREVTTRSGSSVIVAHEGGTGGNCIAEVYAAGLLCRSDEVQRPCGQCNSCAEAYEGNGLGISIIDPVESRDQSAHDILDALKFHPHGSTWRVVLVRDADRLSPSDWSTLHGPLSRIRAYVSVILVTRDLSAIPAPAASLFQIVELMPADFESRLALLEYVVKEQRIDTEETTLRMVAAHAAPGFRAPLRDLERISAEAGGRAISADVASAFYRIGATNEVVAYLKAALSQSSLEDQTRSFEDCSTNAARIGEILQSVLKYWLKGDRQDNRALFRLDADQRAELLDLAKGCAARLKTDIALFFQRALEIWGANESHRPLSYLNALQFHNFVSGVAAPAPPKPKVKSPVISKHRDEEYAQYLNLGQVVEILDAASVMVQEYGHLLNARIVVRYRNAHIRDVVTSIDQELRQRIVKPGSDNHCHYIYVHEAEDVNQTRIALHLPTLRWDVTSWLDSFRQHFPGVESINYERKIEGWRSHASLVRELCRGTNPNLTRHIRMDEVSQTLPLLDILKIPKGDRRTIGSLPIGIHRSNGSRHLKAAARGKAELPYRGIGKRREWRRVLEGWEVDEHVRRQNALMRFHAERIRIESSRVLDAEKARQIEGLRQRLS